MRQLKYRSIQIKYEAQRENLDYSFFRDITLFCDVIKVTTTTSSGHIGKFTARRRGDWWQNWRYLDGQRLPPFYYLRGPELAKRIEKTVKMENSHSIIKYC